MLKYKNYVCFTDADIKNKKFSPPKSYKMAEIRFSHMCVWLQIYTDSNKLGLVTQVTP